VAALGGLVVLGVVGPLRARQARRRLAEGSDLAAPRALGTATAAVALVAVLAAIGVVMPR
jgi:hypothetical protein